MNVNGAIRQAQVNEVEGLSNLRRMPFRAVLGTSCSVKYAGNRKTNGLQPRQPDNSQSHRAGASLLWKNMQLRSPDACERQQKYGTRLENQRLCVELLDTAALWRPEIFY